MVLKQKDSRAGFSIREYAKLTSLSRATLYALPAELQPLSVKIGHRRVIIEQPADFLARLSRAAQGTAKRGRGA